MDNEFVRDTKDILERFFGYTKFIYLKDYIIKHVVKKKLIPNES